MRATLPDDAILAGEPEVCLVDQRGGLQRVVRPLAAKIRGGSPSQFPVDEREQVVARLEISAAPRAQEVADGVGRLRHFHQCRIASTIGPCPRRVNRSPDRRVTQFAVRFPRYVPARVHSGPARGGHGETVVRLRPERRGRRSGSAAIVPPSWAPNARDAFPLVVVVDDRAQILPRVLDQAEKEAARIYWQAGVKAEWLTPSALTRAFGDDENLPPVRQAFHRSVDHPAPSSSDAHHFEVPDGGRTSHRRRLRGSGVRVL